MGELPRLDWTAEEAQAADARYRAAHPEVRDGPGFPFMQWAALQTIEAWRPAIDAGDGFALLGAIRKCANHDLAMPEWLARRFIRCYDQVLSCRIGSWDEAFGSPYPKGKHLDKLRNRREKRFAVYHAVTDATRGDPSIAIDAGLFETIGEGLGIRKTLADKLYYEAKRMLAFPKGRLPK